MPEPENLPVNVKSTAHGRWRRINWTVLKPWPKVTPIFGFAEIGVTFLYFGKFPDSAHIAA
jgi:hypothetical protein